MEIVRYLLNKAKHDDDDKRQVKRSWEEDGLKKDTPRAQKTGHRTVE